jgi:hypothetical protein
MIASHQSNDTTEFATIVERLVTRATRQRPELADRLVRAQRIVLREDTPIVLFAAGDASVRSECRDGAAYQVAGARCTCPDAEHRGRLCKHALAVGLYKRAIRAQRDEQARRRSYGTAYEAPGTPGAFVACAACGITALLDERGLCPECGAESRWECTALGEAVLAAVSAAGVA